MAVVDVAEIVSFHFSIIHYCYYYSFIHDLFIYLFIYLDFYCSSDTVEHPGDSLCSYHQSIPPVPRPSWTVVSKILDGLANLG